MKSITIRPPRSRRRNWRATSSAASRFVRVAVSSMSAPLVARAEFTSIATSASVWSITIAPPDGSGTVREYAVSIWCSIWKREKRGTSS
ncbi:ribonuclease E domain protein [Burkholderia mallei]|nr:ribonuclease E domain protein [Burkholderia mallei]KOT15817.1 ribonuclease E domain protein [Burkholderia mallei]KOT19888.1 ribonuclease E domain protein [Burkholderia mallei]